MSDHLLPEDSPPPIDGTADDDQLLCRFCYGTHATEDLIAPCNCKGTSKYVHRNCLDHWRNLQRGFAFFHCTTCKACYTGDLVGVAAYWKSYLLGFSLPVFITFPLLYLSLRTLIDIYKESGFRHAYASDNVLDSIYFGGLVLYIAYDGRRHRRQQAMIGRAEPPLN